MAEGEQLFLCLPQFLPGFWAQKAGPHPHLNLALNSTYLSQELETCLEAPGWQLTLNTG